MEDIVSIKSKLIQTVVGKIIEKGIHKSTGIEVNIDVNECEINHANGKMYFTIGLYGDISDDSIKSLLKSYLL